MVAWVTHSRLTEGSLQGVDRNYSKGRAMPCRPDSVCLPAEIECAEILKGSKICFADRRQWRPRRTQ